MNIVMKSKVRYHDCLIVKNDNNFLLIECFIENKFKRIAVYAPDIAYAEMAGIKYEYHKDKWKAYDSAAEVLTHSSKQYAGVNTSGDSRDKQETRSVSCSDFDYNTIFD